MKSNKSKIFFVKLHFWQFFKLFPSSKLIFGHFWNCKKWNLVKNIREIELFDFTSFLGWTFSNFLSHYDSKWKIKNIGRLSYLWKRRQSLLFDFPNNFIFMKLEAFFNIEFWNSNSNQNQIGWSGRVQWQIIFHLLSLCIQGDSALMLVIWK